MVGVVRSQLFPQLFLPVEASRTRFSTETQPFKSSTVTIHSSSGQTSTLKISPDIIAPERSIVGSEYFRYNELPTNLQRLREHRGYLSQIITHRMEVDQIQQAFEAFFFGCETGKIIIEQ